MTAWLLRQVPQYVGARLEIFTLWIIGSIAWEAVFIFVTGEMILSVSTYVAFGLAAPALGALGAIDVAVHRLPRQISYVAFLLVGMALLFGSSSITKTSVDLVAGIFLMVVVVASFRLVSRGSLGTGDLHLAPLLGLLIGWFDPYQVLMACVVMAMSAALVAGMLIVFRQRKGSDFIAYGPFMLFGTAIAILGARG
jgi:leader peptidase (prepilin peptidase)/N-methyltransferase